MASSWPPNSPGDYLRLVDDVGGDDCRTFGGECPGLRGALSTGCSRDHDDLARHPPRHADPRYRNSAKLTSPLVAYSPITRPVKHLAVSKVQYRPSSSASRISSPPPAAVSRIRSPPMAPWLNRSAVAPSRCAVRPRRPGSSSARCARSRESARAVTMVAPLVPSASIAKKWSSLSRAASPPTPADASTRVETLAVRCC